MPGYYLEYGGVATVIALTVLAVGMLIGFFVREIWSAVFEVGEPKGDSPELREARRQLNLTKSELAAMERLAEGLQEMVEEKERERRIAVSNDQGLRYRIRDLEGIMGAPRDGVQVVVNDKAVWMDEKDPIYWCPTCHAPVFVASEGRSLDTIRCDGGGQHRLTWKAAIVALVVVLFGLTGYAEAACSGAAPAPGWVCIGSGWVPGDHPLAVGVPTPPAPAVPVPGFATLGWGPAVPMGEVLEFTPPLVISPQTIATYTGAGRVYRPIRSAYVGPLVIIQSLGTTSGPSDGYAKAMQIQDLTVWGYPGQECIVIRAINVRLVRPMPSGCGIGIAVELAVNVTIQDAEVTNNGIGMVLRGNGPGSFIGPNSITTLAMDRGRIAGSLGAGVRVAHAMGGILFSGTIVEGNRGPAFHVEPFPAWPSAQIGPIWLRDVWMEANGGANVDALGRIRLEGYSGTW